MREPGASAPGIKTRSRTATALLLMLAAGVSACTQGAHLDPARAQGALPLQRYDNFQALAANGRVLVAAGSGGVLLTSTDEGAHWRREVLAEPTSIIGLAACPEGQLAALDFHRKVWVADAQAQGWTAHALPDGVNALALTCDAAGKLWAVGSYSTILSSADLGATWSQTTLDADTILTTVQFLDASQGVISGEFGTLLKTSDGGATWVRQAGLPETFYPYSTLFLDAQRGYTSGVAGVLLATADGGKTWTAQDNPVQAPMYTLLPHGGEVMAAGANGQVLQHGEGGWTRLEGVPPVRAHFAAGTVLKDERLVLAGGVGALVSMNLSAGAQP